MYTPHSYCGAIRRAWELHCKYADKLERLAAKFGVEVKVRRAGYWHVHQLRHTAASLIAAEHGIEAARICLGHQHVQTTKLYAEDASEKAAEVMRKVG